MLTYFVHCSNAIPDRAVCFLGRFLPKLGGATLAPPFSCKAQGAARKPASAPSGRAPAKWDLGIGPASMPQVLNRFANGQLLAGAGADFRKLLSASSITWAASS